MGAERFVGTWSLLASEFHRTDGAVLYPYGQYAIGMLTYDLAGNMAAQVMRPDRLAFASSDLYKGTPEETKTAFDGVIAYFGRYDINEIAETVTHHIIGCTFPNWIGSDQLRYYKFSDQRLTLSTPPILAGGSNLVGILIWDRIA
jgi:Lipocalin-like domain